MDERFGHTIAALATPPGRGGIAIVRISGQDAEGMLTRVFRPAGGEQGFPSHVMRYGQAVDGAAVIDEAMAVLMRAPRSYTCEDVAEIHLHGGEYVVDRLLQALWKFGARPALPGEFTKRAFLNGRIDLSQAEAVMQLISAGGEQAARAALRDLRGGASGYIRQAQEELLDILSGVTAALDYPEEIEEAEATPDLRKRCETLARRLMKSVDERGARILESGLEVAIAGRPNVGKSSLLNLLIGEERAIVTDEAGTTRDIVRGSAVLEGLRVNFSDTAGIRESEQRAEIIGIERARAAIEQADLVLMVLDQGLPMDKADRALLAQLAVRPHIVVLNKADLPTQCNLPEGMLISARTGEGLPALRQAIAAYAGKPGDFGLHLARHMRLARLSADALGEAARAMEAGEPLDLCAVHLQEALLHLGEVTGERVTEGLLDRVFSNFCVGK